MHLDRTFLYLYFAGLILVGLYNTFFSKSRAIEHRLTLRSPYLLAIMLFLNSLGGGAIFGVAEKTFASGPTYYYSLLFAILADIAIGFFIAPKIAHTRACSVGGILESSYGKSGRILTGICAALVAVGYIAIQLNVSRKVFKHMLNLNDVAGAWISYAIVAFYTLGGGPRSVLVNGVLQFLMLVVAMPLVSFICIQNWGFSNFGNSLFDKGVLAPDYLELVGLSLSFMCMGLDPVFIQRNLLAKSSRVAVGAATLKALLYSAFITLAALNGLVAKGALPAAKSENALPLLISTYMPNGLSGIAIVGIFSALMSTADSSLEVVTNSIREDILPSKAKGYARVLSLLVGMLGVLVSLQFEYAMDLALFIAGCWVPTVVVPIVASLYGRVVSKASLFLIAITSFSIFLLGQKYGFPLGLRSTFVATTASALLFCTAYLAEKFYSKFK